MIILVMDNSDYPVLYSFRRCPYAMRGRMAILAAGVKCQMREVLLSDKPDEMLAISNKGTVPVLQLTDGRIIDESLDVMYWALQQSDPDQWLKTDKEETRALIEHNDFDFKDKLDRYKYFVRYPEHSQKHYREQAEEFLDELEKRLKENKGVGLMDKRLSLADIAIFPFIRQFSRVDYDWFDNSPYLKIRKWLKRLEESNRFQHVMKKYELWTSASKIEFFP